MRVVIADDHPIVLMGIRIALQAQCNRFEIVGEAANGMELIDLLALTPCDLVITDFVMTDASNGYDGLILLDALRSSHPKLPIIVLSMLNNPALVQGMLAAGVRGVMDKLSMTRELMLAVTAVASGRIYLSEHTRRQLFEYSAKDAKMLSAREAEVVRLFAQGLTVTDIASRTGRSVRTISQQKRDAMRKLGLPGDKQLHEYARSTGLS
jgi:two-component system capsular synthesis response regulator RcsB